MGVFHGGRRGTGASAQRYPGNASTTFESIPELPEDRSSTGGARNVTTAASSSSRPTWNWPFQNSISYTSSSHHTRTESAAPSHSHTASFQRRLSSGWDKIRPASSVLGNDIIPDYVVHFLRGETPETLARKKQGEKVVEVRAPEAVRSSIHLRVSQGADDYLSLRTNSRMEGDIEKDHGLKRGRSLRRFMSGWKGGVVLTVAVTFAIFVVALVCVVLAVTRGMLSSGSETIFEGSCEKVSDVNQGLHGAMAVFSFVFIAGANYVAQILVSPTRAEVDAAHAKQTWLDIGIPSMRNLGGIGPGKAVLAAFVLVIAAGSQVLYNAVVLPVVDQDTCALTLNGPLLITIAALNLLFISLSILAIVTVGSSAPLVTLGDAIASFLTETDPTTDAACLLSKADVKTKIWTIGEARYWFTTSHRWMQTPSAGRWVLWVFTWVAPLAMAAAMLSVTLVDNSENPLVWGRVNSTHTLPDIPRWGLALIVALPQLLLAVLYWSTNALVSVMYLSYEFSRFAVPDNLQPLRVSSEPVGFQTTSFYITLPRLVSWILFMLFAIMSFMLSQSFKLEIVQTSTSLGFAPLPLVILLGLLVITAIVVFGLSLQSSNLPADPENHRPGNPLVLKGGSCSAVISARCHRAEDEMEDVAVRPLSWGVVDFGSVTGQGVGHATFSARPVDYLRIGKAYA